MVNEWEKVKHIIKSSQFDRNNNFKNILDLNQGRKETDTSNDRQENLTYH